MTTLNKNFYQPVVGTTPGGPGGWGDQIDVNFGVIDSCFGSTISFTLSNSDITLTPTDLQNLRFTFSGNLSANVSVIFPSGIPGPAGAWIINNITTGNYTITLKTSGTGATIPLTNRYGMFTVYSDGVNNMYMVDNTTPSGAVQAFASATAPYGWLACDGAPYQITSYQGLYSVIGSLWNTTAPAGYFNVPDFRGMFVRGTGTNGAYPTAVGGPVGVSGYQGDLYLNHTHTDSGHTHIQSIGTVTIVGGGNTQYVMGSSSSGFITQTGFANIQLSTTGGSETRPKNFSVLYCIKT